MPHFIKSRNPQGRYRAGQFHSTEGRIWPDNAFTSAQLTAIKKDSALICEKLSDAEAAANGGEEKKDA